MRNVFEGSSAEDRAEAYAMDAEGYTPPIGEPPTPDRYRSPFIQAVFKGENGSMGFRTGEVYELVVNGSSIRRVAMGPWIPYGSLEAFFKNWRVVGQQ